MVGTIAAVLMCIGLTMMIVTGLFPTLTKHR